jgi:two-component system, NarL family, nitrate/nitrite response regulator NarL
MEEQTGEKRLRLIVLSEQALLRTSLARFLSSEPGLEVVRECASCGEALDTLKTSPIDVVLLDVAVACADAKDFVSAARSAGYPGRVLILAENAEAERLTMALKLGASGIFRKSEAPDRLVLAIRLVAAGAVWVDQSVIALLTVQPSDQSNQVANRRSVALLEEREQKIIQGIMDGLTTRKIGDDMDLSEGTVKNILQGLFAKTGVRKRSQLVRLALEGALGARFAKRQAAATVETVPTNGKSSD